MHASTGTFSLDLIAGVLQIWLPATGAQGSILSAAGKYRTAAVTDEGDVYMWEGWSKPAELSSGRGATGERVAQAMGRPEQGPVSGGVAGKRPPRALASNGADEASQDAAAARRGRKSERALALVDQLILPARCHTCTTWQSFPMHQASWGYVCTCCGILLETWKMF